MLCTSSRRNWFLPFICEAKNTATINIRVHTEQISMQTNRLDYFAAAVWSIKRSNLNSFLHSPCLPSTRRQSSFHTHGRLYRLRLSRRNTCNSQYKYPTFAYTFIGTRTVLRVSANWSGGYVLSTGILWLLNTKERKWFIIIIYMRSRCRIRRKSNYRGVSYVLSYCTSQDFAAESSRRQI